MKKLFLKKFKKKRLNENISPKNLIPNEFYWVKIVSKSGNITSEIAQFNGFPDKNSDKYHPSDKEDDIWNIFGVDEYYISDFVKQIIPIKHIEKP